MEKILERTGWLVGKDVLNRLQQSHFILIGLGGVGSYAAEAVARCGIGKITLIDPDRVEASNLNRQLPALHSTLGKFKVEVVRERILDINPSVQVIALPFAYDSSTSKSILEVKPDYVLDAIDSLSDKVHLIKACLELHIPMISSMGTANRVDPTQFIVADISETRICPLARRLRRELHRENIYQGVRVVYSQETPRPITEGAGGLGTVSFVPPVAGLIMASAAIRDIGDL